MERSDRGTSRRRGAGPPALEGSCGSSSFYIAASPSRTLYVGFTNDLERRMFEHKHKLVQGFTSRYGVMRLVHMETFANVDDAIAREKELKGWRREKKIALIERQNPKWWDLSHGWYEE